MNNKCTACGGWDVDRIQVCKKHSGSNSLLIDGLERLRIARDAAYLAADSFKLAGNSTAEAQCFGEGVGLERAAQIIYGVAL